MKPAFQLTMEQEAGIRIFLEKVKTLSREDSIELLIDLYRLMIVKEGIYKDLLKSAIQGKI